MLRSDGTWVIYKVEVLFYPERGEEGWGGPGDSMFANVPAEHRILNPGAYDGKLKEPFEAFSSSGECWQETGIHGTFDRDLGVQMLNHLSRYNPKYKMRLVQMVVSQTRKTLMEAAKTDER